MNFHDICEFYGDDQFCNFKAEALQLPHYEFAKDKIVFLNVEQTKFKVAEGDRLDEYEVSAYKLDDTLPEEIKKQIDSLIDSRTAFFQTVRFVLSIAINNKIKYFHSFAIRMALTVPDGVDPKTLTKEQIEKLEKKPIIIIRGCAQKGSTVPVVEETKKEEVIETPKQEVVATPKE